MTFNQIYNLFVTSCFLVILFCFGFLFYQSMQNPFMDLPGTHISSADYYWIIDPTDPLKQRRIVEPPLLAAVKGQQFPIGRTFILARTVHASIYKEVDCPGGQTFPVLDPGSGGRILLKGTEERISPTVIMTGPGSPPAGQDCIYRVWFIINRNPFVPPLVQPLRPVPIRVYAPDSKVIPATPVN